MSLMKRRESKGVFGLKRGFGKDFRVFDVLGNSSVTVNHLVHQVIQSWLVGCCSSSSG